MTALEFLGRMRSLADVAPIISVSDEEMYRLLDLAEKNTAPITNEEWDFAVEENSDGDCTDYRAVCEQLLAGRK